MKAVSLCFAALILALGVSVQAVFAESEIIFCESVNGHKPVNPGVEFTGPTISAVALLGKAIGKPNVLASLYQETGGVEKLLIRNQIHVDPHWDALIFENMPLAQVGDYKLAISQEDGTELAQGRFRITGIDEDRRIGPQVTRGATLEDLYKKYAPK